MEYNFEKQLQLWKAWEKVVLQYLSWLETTIEVLDLSNNKKFQPLGVDFQVLSVNEYTNILQATFVDIKTDFSVHKSSKIFVETSSSAEKKGCMLTSKAEQFLFMRHLFYTFIPLKRMV